MTSQRASIIAILLLGGSATFGTLAGCPSAEPPLSPDTDPGMVMVDGMTVPDIRPLPAVVPIPSSNLNYKAKVELGKELYFDGRLSKNNQVSCAFCHLPTAGFADPRQTSIGVDGNVGGRQAPTVFNVAFTPLLFWDGRAGSLEEQVLGPIQNPLEMGETHENVVAKLRGISGYQEEFRWVFGTDVTLQGIANAIAAYERTVLSTNSPFDRYARGELKAMDESAIRGLKLFKAKARCILCHNGPNFTDNKFHNLGVPQVGPQKEDLGRYNVTQAEHDKGAFKTPTLRSISETGPYMHDGAFNTMEDVIDFLDQGGGPNPYLSPLIMPLGLADDEKADLLAFLKALTGEPIPFELPHLPE